MLRGSSTTAPRCRGCRKPSNNASDSALARVRSFALSDRQARDRAEKGHIFRRHCGWRCDELQGQIPRTEQLLVADARPVNARCTTQVARLQLAKQLVVKERHDLPRGRRVIEPDGVPYLMRDGIAQVVGIEISIETYLPGLFRIKANKGALDQSYRAGPGLVDDIRESAPHRPRTKRL